jgi:alpha/beta superfamily hydrolase
MFSFAPRGPLRAGLAADDLGNTFWNFWSPPPSSSSSTPYDPFYSLGSLDPHGTWRFSFDYWGYARAESFLEAPRLIVDRLVSGVAFDCSLGLSANRASDGARVWSHDVGADIAGAASGTAGTCSFGDLVRGNNDVFLPLSYVETGSGGRKLRYAIAAFDLNTGARTGWIQSGPIAITSGTGFSGVPLAAADESGNVYGIWPSSSSSGTGRLYALTPAGALRYSVDGVPAGTLAVGSGVVVATSRFGPGHASVPPLTQLLRTSDGALLVSTKQNLLSPVLSGDRLSFFELSGSSYTLTSYDLKANSAWRAPLGTGLLEYLPIMETASGTLVVIQLRSASTNQPGSTGASVQVQFREFDGSGREVTSCALPSPPALERYTAAVLTAGELVFNSTSSGLVSGTALAFDAGRRWPAARGWVTEGGGPARDLRERSSAAAQGCSILSRTRLPAPSGLVVEQITSSSGALSVRGVIVRPADARVHPVILFAHGGFTGMGTPDWNAPAGSCPVCDILKALASAGYAVAASSYRGEDGSGGSVEVCQGEVDDVANLACAVAHEPWADGRFAAYGVSHGAGIVLRLAERDPTLRAAIAFVPPADWATLYDDWQQQVAQGTPLCLADTPRARDAAACLANYDRLSSAVRVPIGGTPASLPAAYAARSPVKNLPMLAPTLIFNGTLDFIVDLSQACAMRRALAGRTEPFKAWYLDKTGQPVVNPGSPPVCGGAFEASAPPIGTGTWPAGTLQFVLEGEDHDVLASPLGTAGHQARTAAYQFLLARMPP